MGARQKLNSINIAGAVVTGGVVGLLTGSWLVFFLTAGALIGAGLCTGDIRPHRRRR